MTSTNSTTVAATEVVAAGRAIKSPVQYLQEPMTANQRDFASYVRHYAEAAGVWPTTEKEQAAFLLGVKGAGLYARYQKAKNQDGGKELAAILSPKPAKAAGSKAAPARAGGRR